MVKKSANGVTLIELMVTVAILAILVALAVPSFTRLIADTRMSGHANTFVSDLNYARSEAQKLGKSVSLCATSDPDAADPVCDGNEWKGGWIIFVDADADNARTTGGDETLLRRREALIGASTAVGAPARGALRFNAQGRIAGGQSNFSFTHEISDVSRLICIGTTGRPRIVKGSSTC
jgi:type IV fimbrial biogenesis protein FimT